MLPIYVKPVDRSTCHVGTDRVLTFRLRTKGRTDDSEGDDSRLGLIVFPFQSPSLNRRRFVGRHRRQTNCVIDEYGIYCILLSLHDER